MINDNMEKCFNQLEMIIDLKRDVSQRDDNECKLILRTLNELKMEIEKCEHTLNILYPEKIPEEDVRKVIQNILKEENPTGLNIKLIAGTPGLYNEQTLPESLRVMNWG